MWIKTGLSTILVLALITTNQLIAQTESIAKREFHATKIVEKPTIDGRITEEIWEQGNWQGDFVQYFPENGGTPSAQTRFKVLYDQENLYVAVVSYDKPENFSTRFNQRDEYSGDMVGIMIDSYNDQVTAFEFALSSAGQKMDIKHPNKKGKGVTWNAVWEGASSLTDSAWCAEFKIPFSQIRYNSYDVHNWGFQVWRWIDHKQEETQWQLIPYQSRQYISYFGRMNGISEIRESRQIELLPYASAKFEYKGEEDNPYIEKYRFSPNAGIDAKIGISSNFTLDATINPDFGQVEADPSVLNLSANEIFFMEKRPFFMEGRDILEYEIDNKSLFYSRRIGAKPHYSPDADEDLGEYFDGPQSTTILGSAKLTGKTKKGLSIGVLETVTTPEHGTIYREGRNSEVEVEPLSNYFVGRVKKESDDANTFIGGTINSVVRDLSDETLRDELAATATSGGFDFQHRWKDKTYFVNINGAFSHIEGSKAAILSKQESHIHRFQRPDAEHLRLDTTRTSLTGTSGLFEIGKIGGQFRFGIEGYFWSPSFNTNDLGFLNKADVISQETWVSYRTQKPFSIFRDILAFAKWDNDWSFGGEHIGSKINSLARGSFKNLWSFNTDMEFMLPRVDPRVLRGGPALKQDGYCGGGGILQSDKSKKYQIGIGYFRYVAFKTDGKGQFPIITFNAHPVDKLRLEMETNLDLQNFTYEYIDTDDDEDDGRVRYIMGHMDRKNLSLTLRAEYYIKPEISFSLYASPYFAVVKYPMEHISRVDDPLANELSNRFHTFYDPDANNNNIYLSGNDYIITDSDGSVFSIENPDKSFSQFRGNFVFRWEYKLGSTIYFVWSHQQTRDTNEASPSMERSVRNLFHQPPGDVFMVKFSYWFSV